MNDENPKISITFRGKKMSKTVSVDVSTLSHIFVAHSLNLHNWAKMKKDDMIERVSSSHDRAALVRAADFYWDALDNIAQRKAQNEELEKAFNEVINFA